ncbi:MAG TPA: MarR family winged helix-turn-helix transcriptional regulator [Burkholderiales bacterium]|nr:MarR family winged helix-turn-helix transcriptional regulator [Burkholderiales bacterium]
MKQRPAENVLALVHVLSNLIGRAFHGQIVRRHRVALPEWRVLVTLANHPGSTAAHIVERWAMQPMMTSRAIRSLKRRRWIERRVRHDDRRSYALWLTPKGRLAYRRVEPHASMRYRDIVSCLSRKELAAIDRGLVRLVAQTRRLVRRRSS